jgi:hypothetical protein
MNSAEWPYELPLTNGGHNFKKRYRFPLSFFLETWFDSVTNWIWSMQKVNGARGN